MNQKDTYWMKQALVLARRALGQTSPNPLVGAIVLDTKGKKVGEGFHKKAGEPHAEVVALEQAGSKSKNGVLYVTLEPCCHTGKTPPCTEQIIQNKLSRVVIAIQDPNPLVSGKGIQALEEAGIEVVNGCLETVAQRLNQPFFHWIQTNRPWVTAKIATSLDSKMGIQGSRLGLSGQGVERTTMKLRAEANAILLGVNTILADNPRLTVRGQLSDRRPIRAIVDGNLRTPYTANIFSTDGGPVWIFCNPEKLESPQSRLLQKHGAKIIPITMLEDETLFLPEIIEYFGKQEVLALLVEGGPKLLSRLSRDNLIDQWVVYLTPKILGETYMNKPTLSLSFEHPFPLKFHSVIRRGQDIEIFAKPQEK